MLSWTWQQQLYFMWFLFSLPKVLHIVSTLFCFLVWFEWLILNYIWLNWCILSRIRNETLAIQILLTFIKIFSKIITTNALFLGVYNAQLVSFKSILCTKTTLLKDFGFYYFKTLQRQSAVQHTLTMWLFALWTVISVSMHRIVFIVT